MSAIQFDKIEYTHQGKYIKTLLEMYDLTGGSSHDENTISIDDAMSYLPLERFEVIEIFKKMSELGMGRYKIGRRTKPTRLEVTLDASEVRNILNFDILAPNKKNTENKISSKHPESENSIVHSFLLRPDKMIELNLPQDFSTADAKRMKAWLDTIPFD